MKEACKEVYKLSRNKKLIYLVLKSLKSFKKHYMQRFCLAQNPNTPAFILEKLSEDENKNVRHWAEYKSRKKSKKKVIKSTDDQQNKLSKFIESLKT